jgi:hypothetical protein
MTRLVTAPVLALRATTWLPLVSQPAAHTPPQAQAQRQARAQQPGLPDFSGTWTLLIASERNPSIVRELTVTYSAAKGTLAVSRRASGAPYADTYNFGSTGGTVVQGDRGPMIKGLRTVGWENKVLVILEVSSLHRDQDSGREERWSMDDKGQLTTVITIWSPGNAPNTVTALYKRQQVAK